MNTKTLFINNQASSDAVDTYPTISEALLHIPDDDDIPVRLLVSPGRYYEKLIIAKPNLTLEGTGDSPSDTVIYFDDYAFADMPDGSKRGTFRSFTLLVDAYNVTLRNLTIENSSGDPITHGQAIALYADGDNLICENCRLLGHQDTLFTGPLPLKELQPHGFVGPKEYAPRLATHQLYSNCYICGDVDFIFGSATVYFDCCTIESLYREKTAAEPQGYVTAASTYEGQEYGYVFNNCRIISAGCRPGSVYLGRPWRDYARTVFINCDLGSHISPLGFHDWNKPAAREHCFYATYGCTQAGDHFAPGCDFASELTSEEATSYSRASILGF